MPWVHWGALPATVRRVIEAKTGPVVHTVSATNGTAADMASTLHVADGEPVFCKAIPADSPAAWMHYNEIRVNRFLPADITPAILWAGDDAGWLWAVFEHAPGRHADLSPGSPDLPRVARLLSELSDRLTPCPVPVLRLQERWADLRTWEWHDRESLAGDTLVHTDLAAHNILIDENRLIAIDWAWPTQGPAWIDTAYTVIRLIIAGHTPKRAEAWATTVPAWETAAPEGIDAFLAAVTERWTEQPTPRTPAFLAATGQWRSHRHQ